MDFGLTGKVALVTGSGSQKGFGKAIALTLAKEGCDVVVADIDLEGAKQTASEIEAMGRKALPVKASITSSAEVNEMVKAAIATFGHIDILVNNAGGLIALKRYVDRTEAERDADINLNLKGAMNCTSAVLGQMIERKYGKIVNVASIGANKGVPRNVAYGAAKAGIIGFTKNLATEVGPDGINVNCIAPGLGLTNFGGGAPPPEALKDAMARIPIRRTIAPQDIANAVVFLVSDVSAGIDAQVIGVDGGESSI